MLRRKRGVALFLFVLTGAIVGGMIGDALQTSQFFGENCKKIRFKRVIFKKVEPARNQLYCNATNSVANYCQLIRICLATPRALFEFAIARFRKQGITVYLVPICFNFFENNSFKSDFLQFSLKNCDQNVIKYS